MFKEQNTKKSEHPRFVLRNIFSRKHGVDNVCVLFASCVFVLFPRSICASVTCQLKAAYLPIQPTGYRVIYCIATNFCGRCCMFIVLDKYDGNSFYWNGPN